MNSIAKTFAAAAIGVSAIAALAIPAQAASTPMAPDYYNRQETSAAARQNFEWRSHAPADGEWRALVRDNAYSGNHDATQPQRGYGF